MNTTINYNNNTFTINNINLSKDLSDRDIKVLTYGRSKDSLNPFHIALINNIKDIYLNKLLDLLNDYIITLNKSIIYDLILTAVNAIKSKHILKRLISYINLNEIPWKNFSLILKSIIKTGRKFKIYKLFIKDIVIKDYGYEKTNKINKFPLKRVNKIPHNNLLNHAIKNNIKDIKIINLLCNDISINTGNKDNNNPLHLALIKKYPIKIIKLLINEKTILHTNNKNDNPLITAVKYKNDINILKCLINDINIKHINYEGDIAGTLYLKQHYSYKDDIYSDLFNNDNVNVINCKGESFFSLSDMFVSAGFDIDNKNIFKTYYYNPKLYFINRLCYKDYEKFILNIINFDLLISLFCKYKISDDRPAVLNQIISILEVYDLNYTNLHHNNILMEVLNNTLADHTIINLLVTENAINQVNLKKENALIISMINNTIPANKIHLLVSDISIKQKDTHGFTPLCYAFIENLYSNFDIINSLIVKKTYTHDYFTKTSLENVNYICSNLINLNEVPTDGVLFIPQKNINDERYIILDDDATGILKIAYL